MNTILAYFFTTLLCSLFLAQITVLICFECPLFVNHGVHQFLMAAILPVLRSPRAR